MPGIEAYGRADWPIIRRSKFGSWSSAMPRPPAEVLRADPLRDRRFAVQHAAQMLNVLTNNLKTSTISLNLPLCRQRRAGLIPARSMARTSSPGT
jgi:hypothetical protein